MALEIFFIVCIVVVGFTCGVLISRYLRSR